MNFSIGALHVTLFAQEGEGSNQEVPPQEDPPEEDMLGPPRSERFLPKEMAEAVAARKAAQKQQQDYLQVCLV
jgi:hypothetical protein